MYKSVNVICASIITIKRRSLAERKLLAAHRSEALNLGAEPVQTLMP